jgi:hypothetical protein
LTYFVAELFQERNYIENSLLFSERLSRKSKLNRIEKVYISFSFKLLRAFQI